MSWELKQTSAVQWFLNVATTVVTCVAGIRYSVTLIWVLAISVSSGGQREESSAGSKGYQPPMMVPETDVKRTFKRLTRLSQEAQK